LSENFPRVSVIIPAYNQGRFLKDAVQSVLDQTYQDYEIIVIDDGSTDNTREIAAQFGSRIRYCFQENLGLGGARNTGISLAHGNYLALLDSDDTWLPGYLEKMMALAAANPEAAVLYCGIRCMDADGNEVPQILHAKIVADAELYQTLVSGNFLIPSSIVLLRSAVVEAGMFDRDTTTIHGCEDWDLWLRLAKQYRFVGTTECLMRYRIHGSSLSADPDKMQSAVRAVIEKHFGSDNEPWEKCPKIKRIAYGGVFRYYVFTSILRKNDWKNSAKYLASALLADPEISTDLDFFYDLAMGAQPLGFRGTSTKLEIEKNAAALLEMLEDVYRSPSMPVRNNGKRKVFGTAFFGLGVVAYNSNHRPAARRYLLGAIFYRPELIANRLVLGDLIKSCLGHRLVEFLKQRRKSYS
jgi:glycosyltransferase involved in cell wall biosynthesis